MITTIISRFPKESSRYIYKKIEEDLKNGKKAILLVPEQYTLQTDINFMKNISYKSVMDAKILSFSSLKSFITDKIKYDASTGETIYLVPESQVPDDYLDSMIAEVENRLYISDEVIGTDYFSFVYGKSSDR